MKKTIYRLFIYLIFASSGSIILLSASCKKEEECAYPGLSKANLIGYVNLFDDGKVSLDNDGMYVYIAGSVPEMGDTTDANGYYSFPDLGFGNHLISFEKEGYGDVDLYINHDNQCELSNQMLDLQLGKRSTTSVTSFSAEVLGLNTILNISISPDPTDEKDGYVRILFHNESNVSNYLYTNESGLITMTSNTKQHVVSISNFYDMGFVSGETVFAKIYGDSYHSNEYFDPLTNNFVFPNVNIVSQPHIELTVP